VIVASETSHSVSVSTPAEKLRSVIGHRNINRPMESPPLRPTRNVDIESASRNGTRRRRIGSINCGVCTGRAACRPVRDSHWRGFLLAAPTIAATHSSISAYSSASLI
jgi:hypothetical protein